MKLLTFFLSALLWLVPLCAKTAEPVTFTRVTYPGDSFLYSVSHMADPTIKFASYFETESQITFILFDSDLNEKDRFTISKPKDCNSGSPYRLGNVDATGECYVSEYLVTQHLFNNDNEYEVILQGFTKEKDERVRRIYNSKGVMLGNMPNHDCKAYLFMYDDKSYLYYDDEDSDWKHRSFLYAANITADVQTLNEAAPQLQVLPNPVTAGEQINVTFAPMKSNGKLIATDTKGMQIVSINLGKGETQASFPADRLSNGINIIYLYNGESEVISTSKIIRK